MSEPPSPRGYDALGARPGIRRAVAGFSVRIIADPALAGYFAGVDLDAVRAHQVDLLVAAVGGPRRYTGRDMATAHAGVRITDTDFVRMLGHLNAALVDAGADDGTIRAVIIPVSGLRTSIVGA